MSHYPDAVALTQKLLSFNTINPPGAEQECAAYLGSLLQAAGFQVDYAAFAPTRTSVVARIGRSMDKPPLGFTGHMDTVPLGAAQWKRDAFGASLEGGRLYGRGSSDMKSGVAGFVIAAIALAERLRESPGVTLVLTADEECGCGGAAFLAQNTSLLGKVGALLVGEPTANYPLVGHKGALWLEARTSGVTAHGSMPERGDNAIYKAVRAVDILRDFDFAVEPHHLMGRPTLNVGTLHGGINVNSVPDRATIGIDIRTIPGQDHGRVRMRLQQALGEGVEIVPIVDVEAIYTDPLEPWMQQVFAVAGRQLGERPEVRSATYFTDAAVLNAVYRDVPICVLGPGEPQLAHQTDEYCLVDRVEQSVAIYTELIREWTL
ncbi:MAG: M20 family metallopeptidase [Betaproteobacteria bacterium]